MADQFDPDAYLAKVDAKPAPAGFDPDAYLAKIDTKPEPKKPSWYADIAKSAPGALARASAGLAGMVDSAIEFNSPSHPSSQIEHPGILGKIEDFLAPPHDKPRTNLGEKSLTGLKIIMGPAYHEPETAPGKIADFALQNVLFGAKKPVDLLNIPKTLKSLVSGAAGGAAGELVPDDMPKIKMAAQMIGGFTPNAVEAALTSPNRATKNAAAMIKQAMQGKTPEQWAAADKLFQESKQANRPKLLGPEAFSGGSQIQQLASDVAASPVGGAKLRSAIENRPSEVQKSISAHLNDIGENIGMREAANNAEKAGTKVITNAEADQTKQVKPWYDAAAYDKIPDVAAQKIVSKIDDVIKSDKTGILSPKLIQLRKTLVESEGTPAIVNGAGEIVKPAVPPKFVTDIDNLDRARKFFRDEIKLPTLAPGAIPSEISAKMAPILQALRKEMIDSSGNFAKGKALYQQLQEQRIDPLMKGPVGNVAGKGADAQREATYTRVMNELSSDTATPARISKLADELKTVDKTAFPNVARAYLEGELNKSLKDLQGRKNPMAGANFRNLVEGTPQQAKNLRTIIQKTAEAQGQDGAKTYQGFGKLLDVLDATGRIPGMGSQTQSRMENAATARSNPVSGAVEAISTTPTKGIVKWLNDMVYRGTYSKLAEVFTSPESVKDMQKLANLKSTSTEARQIVNVMLTSATNSTNGDKKDDKNRDGKGDKD